MRCTGPVAATVLGLGTLIASSVGVAAQENSPVFRA